MAENLGDAVLYLKTDDSKFTSGLNKARGGAEGLTGAFIKAQIAVDVLKKAFQVLGRAITDSVDKFIEQERVEKQLEAVLKSTNEAAGLQKDKLLDMASGLQEMTTYGDEAIIGAENLLLTFTKIGKETFPDALETVLDMSTALGQDLKTSALQVGKALQDPVGQASALRRAGVNVTDELKNMMKAMVDSGDLAGAQALLLKELSVEFGGAAKAARDTFGGALAGLQNNFGDLQETIGGYISTIGKPFIEQLDDTVSGITDFLESQEGIAAVTDAVKVFATVLSVAWEIGSQLWDIFTGFVNKVLSGLQEGLSTVAGEGNETNAVFLLLGGALQTVSAGFNIVATMINVAIRNVFNLVSAVLKSIDTLVKFGEALIDPFNQEKWDAVGEAGETALNAFVKLGVDYVGGIGDVIKVTFDEINKFWEETEATADELELNVTENVKKVDAAMHELTISTKDTTDALNDLKDAGDELADSEEENTENEVAFKSEWHEVEMEQIAEITEAERLSIEQRKQFYEDLKNHGINTTKQLFGAMGEALVLGSDGWVDFAIIAVNSIADVIDALAQQAVVQALGAAAIGNIPASLAWGAAAAAGFTGAGIVRGLGQAARKQAEYAKKVAEKEAEEEKLKKENEKLAKNIKSAQFGADFITTGPQLLLVGERGREHVSVTPEGKIRGGGITIHSLITVNGNIERNVDIDEAMDRAGRELQRLIRGTI